MLKDVFYYGKKPNVHPREKFAIDLNDARSQATTDHFWIVNEYCDYSNFDWDFDFEFLPDEDVWAEDHNNVWPSQHQKDSGTWLCPKEHSDIIVYRADVDPVKRKNEINIHWSIIEDIDIATFDFSWHPDPTDPPYIYKWGCKFFPVQFKSCLEYHVPNASDIKYMDTIVQLLPNNERIKIYQPINIEKWDLSWRPDPREPAYIYVWGNKYIPGELQSTLEYHVPGAVEKKYMPELVDVLPELDRWKEYHQVDKTKFDFSWRPDPREPAYIYVWGNKYIPGELQSTLEYHVPGATEKKYMPELVEVLPEWDKWKILHSIDKTKFDFSWRPDPTSPPYIYVFGNNFYDAVKMPTVEYHTPGATDKKYVYELTATLSPDFSKFEHFEDAVLPDYSWVPDPHDPPYIYVWGNQWNSPLDKISIQYVVEGATTYKYMDVRSTRKPSSVNWVIVDDYVDVHNIDFSWEPNPTEPPYIYIWGNKYIPGELQSTLEYHVPGATEKKYMPELVDVLPEWDKWKKLIPIDESKFDFSWRPDPHSPPYIYIWGNQWNDATIEPTLEYHVPGATEKKYMPELVDVLPELDRWKEYHQVDKTKFDLSWRPNPTEPAYIYVWGNKYIPGELQSTLEYHVPGAVEKKYMPELVDVLPEWDKWKEYQQVDKTKFDFSWRPDPREPAYIYVWGNKYIPGEIQSTLEYHVPGATEKKYMPELIPVLPEKDRWKEYQQVDKTKFDMTWRPDPREPAYIYVWGNKYIPGEIQSTLEYHVPGATEKKYMPELVDVLPELDRWKKLIPVDTNSFDFSWRPDPREPAYIYVWGNQSNIAEKEPTLEYHVPGATERKYMHDAVARTLPIPEFWKIGLPIESFDFSWRPDPHSPPYIYVFGNQWNDATIEPTLEYHVPGATEKKYITEVIAKTSPNFENWKILTSIDTNKFDLSWRPNPTEPPYIYIWGNKYIPGELQSTLEYHVPGATEKKYMPELVDVLPEWDKWKKLIPVDTNSFDFSWRPDPREPAFIYVFGNQWNDATIEPTLEYHAPGATEKKYITDVKAKTSPNFENWKTLLSIESFDFSWRPDPHSPPYIYVFGNQWYDAVTEPTLEYHVPGAVEKKYITDIVADVAPNMTHWKLSFGVDDFDFSWHPNPLSPPMIYQFGTLLDDIHLKDGPVYTVPGNDGTIVYLENSIANKKKIDYQKYYITTSLTDLINEHPNEIFWALRKNINYDSFNFEWRPTKENVFHINVFGSPESETTQTYFVNTRMINEGYSKLNFVENKKIDDEYLSSLFKQIDMFFVDKGNKESSDRFEQLKAKFPTIQKTRFLNTWVDTINRCLNKCTTELCWILNSELDYAEFDFNYYPNPWQMKMVHVFGTQWNHWGTTFIVNKESFPHDTKYVKIVEHLPNINFVKKSKAKATNHLYDVYFIDHGNDDAINIQEALRQRNLTVHTIQYEVDYLYTFKKLLEEIPIRKDHYIWICSSLCKYDSFDFTYICDPFSLEQLHVFPSDKQKFGDTFFVNVNKFRTIVNELTKLTDVEKINFNNTFRVQRLPAPVIITESDTHIDFSKYQHNFPYAVYITSDNKNIMMKDDEPMSLWSADAKNIIVTSDGASRVIIPKEAANYVKKELYDYPYIIKSNRLRQSAPLDIVFLSNGEKCAEENFEHLIKATRGYSNRITRVDGVNGRVNAYHAAANASNTPWLLTVFAKLKVNEKFNWSWQPDRLQVPKHYVFHAKNPVNGLEYGHQAMIAYNKKLTLNNQGTGLDFTMDDEHEVVELLSGTANYNTDAWSTWRTAFREVIKLRNENSEISNQRMECWLGVADGEFGEYSIKGAKDALDYFNVVNGDIDKLKLSYEWDWLKSYFDSRY